MDTRRKRRVQARRANVLQVVMRAEQQLERRMGDRPGRVLARNRIRTARSLRRLSGRLAGLAYRIEQREPDPNVDDTVLQQRVASSLGPVVKQLDLPHVRVRVDDGIVRLEGETDGDASTQAIAQVARGVPGVGEVDTSRLRVLHDDRTRPSYGRRTRRSSAFREITGAVRALDVGDHQVERLAGSVMRVFLACLPPRERAHLAAHLPADVQHLSELAVIVGEPSKPRTVEDLVGQVADAASRTRGTAEQAIRAVLTTLHDLVPEEVDDIAAVLPHDLAVLWNDSKGVQPAGSGPGQAAGEAGVK